MSDIRDFARPLHALQAKRKGLVVCSVNDVESFKVEVKCIYRGESYRVRDNGAVLRCAQPRATNTTP